jgi:endonuclease/exonuclease/phosphatase family metal-dependent hydrolase
MERRMMDFTAVAPDHSVSAFAERTAELSVLTYNVRGLPWPVALRRGAALQEIGRELAQLRAEGRQPDVVLIQEGFRAEMAELFRASGYRYWVQGPPRGGKLTGGGLHILSDAPVVDVRMMAYTACAGFDCLANKGAMLARLAPEGAPGPIEILNTHLNSRHASRAPARDALQAHNRQTDQLFAFINAERDPSLPLLVGGDFNVKGAPARYDHAAAARPYKVVSEFCSEPGSGCGAGASDTGAQPWLRSQDLQAFAGEPDVTVRPVAVATLFDAASPGGRLSDHDGYLVRYQMRWSATLTEERPPVRVRPQLGAWGVKVSWRR